MDKAQSTQACPKAIVRNALKSAFKRAFHWSKIVIWIACSLLATFSGPFGAYGSTSFWHSLSIWLVLFGVGALVALILFDLTEAFFAKLPNAIRSVIFIAVASVVNGVLMHQLLVWVFGRAPNAIPLLQELVLYSLAALCFIRVLKFCVEYNDLEKRSIADVTTEQAPAEKIKQASLPQHSRLAIRLAIPEGECILHVTAKGHFVSVETSETVYSTRMRFSDAVAELHGVCGLTVHRSHWVHRGSIVGWVADSKKPFVVMKNDRRVPISKTYLESVKNADLTLLSLEDVAPEPELSASS